MEIADWGNEIDKHVAASPSTTLPLGCSVELAQALALTVAVSLVTLMTLRPGFVTSNRHVSLIKLVLWTAAATACVAVLACRRESSAGCPPADANAPPVANDPSAALTPGARAYLPPAHFARAP